MNSSALGPIENTRETLVTVLRDLRAYALPCDVFGGWAEELLGLCQPRAHRDIDLVYRGNSLAGFDVIKGDYSPVASKRFHHKRAFTIRNVLCEIILIQDAANRPVTPYWGDLLFHWDQPLLHFEPIDLCGQSITVISAANLLRHRDFHGKTQPNRWRDPNSLVP